MVFDYIKVDGKPSPYVDASGDTGTFVSLLVKAGPGKQLLGASDPMSIHDFVQKWSKVLNIPAKIELVTIEEREKQFPRGLGKEAAHSLLFSLEYGWTGPDPEVLMPTDVSCHIFVQDHF